MEYDLVQQQDQLLIQSLLGQFAEYSLPVGGIKNFGFCDRAAVDQPEGFIQVDVDLDPADEILRVVPGCQLLQSGNEKGHFVIKPGREQTVENSQYGIEVVERWIENLLGMLIEKFEQLAIDADGSHVIA